MKEIRGYITVYMNMTPEQKSKIDSIFTEKVEKIEGIDANFYNCYYTFMLRLDRKFSKDEIKYIRDKYYRDIVELVVILRSEYCLNYIKTFFITFKPILPIKTWLRFEYELLDEINFREFRRYSLTPRYLLCGIKENMFEILEKHGDYIFDFVRLFHPGYKQKHNMDISTQKAEDMCESFRKDITRKCAVSDLKIAIIHKNENLVRTILNEAWIGAPESLSVRQHPGFYPLCDILDE
jgi:hypothetical protein